MAPIASDAFYASLGMARWPVRRLLRSLRFQPHLKIPANKILYCDKDIIMVEPKIQAESGHRPPFLLKQNHLVARAERPDFVHYINQINAPSSMDYSLYPVILLPGILLNGNFFRMTTNGGHLKDLDNLNSFANHLAAQGLNIFTVHPPYAERLYERYVENKLGVKNPFLRDLTFDDLVRNLKLYIDFVCKEAGAKKVIVVGYSLGGMETHAYQAMFPDERIAGMEIIASPAKLTNQPIIQYLRSYNAMAGVLPATPIDPLKFFGRNFKYMSRLLTKVPESLLQYLPILNDLYNFEGITDEEVETLVRTLLYATESITPGMLRQMVEVMAARREFLSADGKTDYYQHMGRIKTPALYIVGEQDTLAPEDNARLAFDKIGTPKKDKRFEVILNTGHLGLIIRDEPMRQVADLTLDFVRKYGRAA